MHIPPLDSFHHKLDSLAEALADPTVFENPREAARLSREHQKLTRLIDLDAELQNARRSLNEAREMLELEDASIREMAVDEITVLETRIPDLERNILRQMLPGDENEDRNTVFEIRAGAGGDEAALFAAVLFRMYTRFAENQGWKVEMMSSSATDGGGFKEVIFLVTGEAVYRSLQFESGVHRVQRVPVTEAGGRIHTSTATVAVLPEAEEVDVHIDPADLEITVSRASGPGGQGVNTTDSAVQIIHRPTGITINCADERSQLKNKAKAMQVLRARLLKARQEEEHARYAAERRGQVGSGDRSERIRTYNFPQSRVTDHRIGLTLHSIDEIIAGDISELIHKLQEADTAARIEAFTRQSNAPETSTNA